MDIKKLFSFDRKSLFSLKSLKRLGYLLGVLALIIAGIMGLRSCGGPGETRSKNLYFVGRDPTFYPLQLGGKEKSFLAFTNDLFDAIATQEGIRIEWIDTSGPLLLSGLENGHYDAIVTTLRPNIVNEERYDFSELYFDLGPVLIVPKNSSLKAFKDMQGHTIGINSGLSLIFNAVRETGANIYSLTFVTYDTNNKALEAVSKGQIDAAIIPAVPAYSLIQSFYSGILKIVTPPLTDEGLRLVALNNPRSEHLIKLFDQAVKKLDQDGIYKKLIEKWNLVDPSIPPKN